MKRPLRGISRNRFLTPGQTYLLKKFVVSDLRETFRLTGGTALGAFYLGHRLSEDLDFFSSEKVPFYVLEGWLKTLDWISEMLYTKQFDRNIFDIKLRDTSTLKVEFTHYPLKNIQNPYLVEGLSVESFIDIIVNKLCAIADRMDAKDYVDVYCALKKSTLSLSHLMDLTEEKCEIKGIRHILKRRLLQIPGGVNKLPLKVDIRSEEIERLFKSLIKKIIEKEIMEGG